MGRLRAVLAAAAVAGGLALTLATPALAAATGDTPGGGHAQAGYVHWGDPCDHAGATGEQRGGGTLVCVQARRDDCPRWHNASPAPAGAGWTRPSVPACPRCVSGPPLGSSASPSPSVSVPPSASTGPSSPATSPAAVGGELPVTGVAVVPLVLAGVGLVAAGLYARRWATARPRRPVR